MFKRRRTGEVEAVVHERLGHGEHRRADGLGCDGLVLSEPAEVHGLADATEMLGGDERTGLHGVRVAEHDLALLVSDDAV